MALRLLKGHSRHRSAAEVKPVLRNDLRVITLVIDFYKQFRVMQKVYEVINELYSMQHLYEITGAVYS